MGMKMVRRQVKFCDDSFCFLLTLLAMTFFCNFAVAQQGYNSVGPSPDAPILPSNMKQARNRGDYNGQNQQYPFLPPNYNMGTLGQYNSNRPDYPGSGGPTYPGTGYPTNGGYPGGSYETVRTTYPFPGFYQTPEGPYQPQPSTEGPAPPPVTQRPPPPTYQPPPPAYSTYQPPPPTYAPPYGTTAQPPSVKPTTSTSSPASTTTKVTTTTMERTTTTTPRATTRPTTTERSTTVRSTPAPTPTTTSERATTKTTSRPSSTSTERATTPHATTTPKPATTTTESITTPRATPTPKPSTTTRTTVKPTPAPTSTTRRTTTTTTTAQPEVELTTAAQTRAPTTFEATFSVRPTASEPTEPMSMIMTTTTLPYTPNRIRGKPHVICEADGIVFSAQTFFPFVGEVFARDRKRDPLCYEKFVGTENNFRVEFPYEACGKPITGARPGESTYSVEVVVSYTNPDGTTTIQSYLARCISQRIRYETEDIPRRIEEAIEELNLVPIVVEKKAQIPNCLMRIVPESEADKHQYGPSDKKPIDDAFIGEKLRIEWSLDPPTEAYGFLVKNCTVKDRLSGIEYVVIDEKGCSTDFHIFSHPHYDTYHDLAIVHWHAFKVPDNGLLSIRCGFQICTDIKDDSGISSCSAIPTPPFCPELVTAPPNSLLLDFESEFFARRGVEELQVAAEVCVVDGQQEPGEYCRFNRHSDRQAATLRDARRFTNSRACISRVLFSALLGLSVLCFLASTGAFLSCVLLRSTARGRRALIKPQPATVVASSTTATAVVGWPPPEDLRLYPERAYDRRLQSSEL